MPILRTTQLCAKHNGPAEQHDHRRTELREATRSAQRVWLVGARRLPKPGDNAMRPTSPERIPMRGGLRFPSSLAEFLGKAMILAS